MIAKLYGAELSAASYFSNEEGQKEQEWAVYAAEKGILSLSKVFSKLEGSPIDFQLNSLTFAACSNDHLGHLIPSATKYATRKGKVSRAANTNLVEFLSFFALTG